MRFVDGLVNLVSGMGTARDKGGQAQYAATVMDDYQLLTAYKASSLIRRAVDLPAEDATREWREWQAEVGQISAIEAEETRLGIQGKTQDATRMARLFGGAALLIGTGDTDPSKAIDPKTVKRGGLKYVTVLTTMDMSAGELDQNPTSPGYGTPMHWTLRGGQIVHPSRVAVFSGMQPMPFYGMDMHPGWGDSVLTGMMPSLIRVDEGAGNVLSLLYEAKVDVFKIPGLMQNLASRGADYSIEIIKRLTLAATGKGISGSLIMDADEQYEQKSASFAGLPDVMDRFAQLASAAAGIPMTLLFGMSPGGFNATGDSDIRAYYDRVKVIQSLRMTPAMKVLDECIVRSALGDYPAEIHYNWRSLWQPTAKDRADVGDKMMQALDKLHSMDVVPSEAIGKAAVNGLTESGAFPGLEAAVAEFYAATPDVDGEDSGAVTVADAAPMTLYVRRDVLNADEIIKWAKTQGFKTTLPASDMHVTIVFSRARVDWMAVGQPWQEKIEIPEGGPRLMERFGDALVLLIAADELKWRHERIKDMGASWDHAEYQPHITISYGAESPDVRGIDPYQGRIILGPEIFQEVKDDWQSSIKEE